MRPRCLPDAGHHPRPETWELFAAVLSNPLSPQPVPTMQSNRSILSLCMLALLPCSMGAGTLVVTLADPATFTDFAIGGSMRLSPAKTAVVWESEIERFANMEGKRLVPDGLTITLHLTDIDMAGDIQPWRSSHANDIRYVENIYPPRLTFTYTVIDAEDKVLAEGSTVERDLGFMFGDGGRIRMYNSFHYEFRLLENWLRRELRNILANPDAS